MLKFTVTGFGGFCLGAFLFGFFVVVYCLFVCLFEAFLKIDLLFLLLVATKLLLSKEK